MADYIICTDDTSDLRTEFYEENDIYLFRMPYSLDGNEYRGDKHISVEEFYKGMRDGKPTRTAQITPSEAEEAIENVLNEGKDLLILSFSSGLSGSCNSMQIAAEALKEKYPDRKIRVVDTLAASTGEGLIVYLAASLRKQGKSLDEVAAWCEENKLHTIHMFTVDDLIYLHRGGRVSKATAVAGAILGIKPVLHVDNEGHLVPIGKVRGRKQSLNALVDGMEKRIGNYKNEIFFVSHCDCEEDAKYVENLVKERFSITKSEINSIGPIIGSHSGPGTVALFFMGEQR